MALNSQRNTGAFLPTTYDFQINKLQSTDVNSPEFKELLVKLYQDISNICKTINLKDTGYVIEEEFVTGKLFAPASDSSKNNFRPIFRKVIDCGTLPNNDTKEIPHNIDISNGFSFISISGAATAPIGLEYLPLPLVSAPSGFEIEVYVNYQNVLITTTSDYTAYTKSYIIVEYIKE